MKRINYVDFIKGMAIIAMAFGHIMYFEQLHPLLLVKLFLPTLGMWECSLLSVASS